MECLTCKLTANRDAGEAPLWDCIVRTSYWDVVHSYNTSLLGWTVLVTRRHIATVAELTEAEASEMGQLVRQVSIGLKQLTNCQKTYVIQFADSPDHPHVHVHIIPVLAYLPKERRAVNIFSYLGVPESEQVSEAEMNAFAFELRKLLISEAP